MEISTDFVTDSSSAGYVVELGAIDRNGKEHTIFESYDDYKWRGNLLALYTDLKAKCEAINMGDLPLVGAEPVQPSALKVSTIEELATVLASDIDVRWVSLESWDDEKKEKDEIDDYNAAFLTGLDEDNAPEDDYDFYDEEESDEDEERLLYSRLSEIRQQFVQNMTRQLSSLENVRKVIYREHCRTFGAPSVLLPESAHRLCELAEAVKAAKGGEKAMAMDDLKKYIETPIVGRWDDKEFEIPFFAESVESRYTLPETNMLPKLVKMLCGNEGSRNYNYVEVEELDLLTRKHVWYIEFDLDAYIHGG